MFLFQMKSDVKLLERDAVVVVVVVVVVAAAAGVFCCFVFLF